MTLKEQWQKDVKQFGELAYLMWEKKEDVNDDYYVFASNLHVFDVIGIVDENGFGSAFGSFHVRRKQSAALPFDKAVLKSLNAINLRGFKMNEFEKWLDKQDSFIVSNVDRFVGRKFLEQCFLSGAKVALENQWQPIETAPISTPIIMRDADNRKELGYMYETDNGIKWCSHGCFDATHWHPVPE